jgi:hypothetical protein
MGRRADLTGGVSGVWVSAPCRNEQVSAAENAALLFVYISWMRNVYIRADAWQPPVGLDAIDATVEVAIAAPATRPILCILHGRLARAVPTAPFLVDLSDEQIDELAIEVHQQLGERVYMPARNAAERGSSPSDPCQLPEFRVEFRVSPLPITAAPQYAGAARDFLETRLQLGSRDGMQDWPLEVSDSYRIAEFCDLYDEVTDPLVRFDLMELALYSLDAAAGVPGWRETLPWSWFEATLRRHLALHGHTIAY